MDERPIQSDGKAAATVDDRAVVANQVTAFRRAARLAAVNPLRLLPASPLAVLQLLDAPLSALIDNAAPFERLREALTTAGPSAAETSARRSVTSLPRSANRDQSVATRGAIDNAAHTRGLKSPTSLATSVATLAQRRAAARSGATSGLLNAAARNATDAARRGDVGGVVKPITDVIAQTVERAARAVADGTTISSPAAITAGIARAAVDAINSGIGALTNAGARQASSRTARKSAGNRPFVTGADRALADLVAAIVDSARDASTQRPSRSGIDRIIDAPGDIARTAAGVITKGIAALTPSKSRRPARLGDLLGAELRRALADINKKADQIGNQPANDRAAVTPAIDLSSTRADAARPQPGANAAARADDLFEALYRGGVDLSWP